jgi:predicted DCC family thiol-disulfide oxidoreductase YuxK
MQLAYFAAWRGDFRPYDTTMSARPTQTTAPGREAWITLYDGHCRICTAGAERLARWGAPGKVELRSFQEPGVLDAFPGITFDECMKRIVVVSPAGRIFAGAEGIARVVMTIRFIGVLAYAYYLPGIKQLAELVYRTVANNRYRLGGKTPCADDACALHAPADP